MFADSSLVGSRERAAVLALMTRRALPANRLAGAIDDEGSAMRLLEQLDEPSNRLFVGVHEGDRRRVSCLEAMQHEVAMQSKATPTRHE
jgi:hypothetical protein